MKKTRIESDVLGDIEVESDKYWKSQTPVSYTHLRAHETSV